MVSLPLSFLIFSFIHIFSIHMRLRRRRARNADQRPQATTVQFYFSRSSSITILSLSLRHHRLLSRPLTCNHTGQAEQIRFLPALTATPSFPLVPASLSTSDFRAAAISTNHHYATAAHPSNSLLVSFPWYQSLSIIFCIFSRASRRSVSARVHSYRTSPSPDQASSSTPRCI